MNNAADDVNEAIRSELRLIDPQVRLSSEQAAELLDPDFVEVGSSGRRWSRTDMLAALPDLPGADDEPYLATEMSGVLLAPGLVHLTYQTTRPGRRARRSSLWRRSADGRQWRLYYHQATPVPPSEQG
ncbi:DUF4440 domain-containing protein [Kitasatospora sp. NPDC017646]|uniref:nuclear transport factor 2 family protein n=1 Tax=Kitasatospora sp. NPDC017646 TaxID=3364024 RepID=UPI003794E448